MTTNTPEAAKAAPDAPVSEIKRILAEVSTNPAKVEFPRDEWGMTTELRKAGLRAASSIRGNDVKMRIYLETLQVLAAHVKARMADDKAELQRRIEQSNKLAFSERAYGTPVPASTEEPAVPMK